MKLKELTIATMIVMILHIVILCLVTGTIGSFLIPYTLNTWLVYVGKEATVTGMNGFLWGLFPPFGMASLPSSFLTWIAMLFLI